MPLLNASEGETSFGMTTAGGFAIQSGPARMAARP
jgi:hypothetical protein